MRPRRGIVVLQRSPRGDGLSQAFRSHRQDRRGAWRGLRHRQILGGGAGVARRRRDVRRSWQPRARRRPPPAFATNGGLAEAAICDAAECRRCRGARDHGDAEVSAPRYRRHHAGAEHPQDHPRLYRGGSRPRHQPQHQGHGVVLPGLRPHHDQATGRQHHRLLIGARRHHRAGAWRSMARPRRRSACW